MKGRNHLFDMLRGVAALLVVMYHFGPTSALPVDSGYLAVDMFFVLSGYVIAQSYEGRLSAGMGFGGFMTARLIRLYPLLALGAVIGLGREVCKIVLAHPDKLLPVQLAIAGVTNLLILPAPIGRGFLFPLDGPLWSLFFEIIANIVFVLGAYRFRNSALKLIILISGALLVYAIYRCRTAGPGWSWDSAWAGFARVGFGFTLGHLFYRLFPPQPSRRKTWWVLVLVAAIAILLIVPTPSHLFGAIWKAASLALCPLAVLIATRIEVPDSMSRFAGFLGDMSYPLYAIHVPLKYFMDYFLRRHGVPDQWLVIEVPVLLIASYLAARFYDAPIRKRLTTRMAVRESAPPQTI